MAPEKPKNTTIKITSAIVVILAVVLLTIASNATRTQQKSQSIIASTPTTTTSTPSSTPTSATTSTTTATTSSGYKDGSYTATSDYYVPHGSEEIQVNVTLKNGIITGSNVENSEYDGESAQYQEGFASEYKSFVIGKKISGLELSYISGASDTTQGFNDALSKIRTEAE